MCVQSTNENEPEEYMDSTGVSFKIRYNQHIHSFKPNNSTRTTLSKYFRKNYNKDNVKIAWITLVFVLIYILINCFKFCITQA